MKYFFGLALLLICGACIQLGGEPQPARYYLLSPQQQPSFDFDVQGVKLTLGPISFPPYLDRPQLVSRNSRHEILVAESDRWAEPLPDNLLRVLKENLSRNLDGISISDYPWQPTDGRGLALQLTINQFDGVIGQNTLVDIRWLLLNSNNGQELDRGHFVSRLLIGNSHKQLVAGLNESLNQLSHQLSQAVAEQVD